MKLLAILTGIRSTVYMNNTFTVRQRAHTTIIYGPKRCTT